MVKKSTCQMLLFLLLADFLLCALSVQLATASGDIYIKADGSIDPSTAPIQRNAYIYTFTGDISGDIIVQKDNIVINGASHTLQGTGVEFGINVTSRTNVTIQNMVITTFYDAVYLDSSNQITISGTNVTENTDDGIRISDSSNNSIWGNNVTGNGYEGIYILTSSNNTISENNITTTTGDGVYLWGSSNDTVFRNNISNNWWGITSLYSSNNKIFHNNLINNPTQADSESSADSWDDGYPSGGNYWNDYSGTDQRCGPSQDHPGSDGIGDTPYTIDSSNKDNYPLMNPWIPPSGHNVAIISAISSKVVIFQGFTGNLTVYGANRGEYSETFNVTVYVNTTSVGSVALPLESGSTINITLSWNTTGFAKGNYAIGAYAWPVPGETSTTDNNFTGGWVVVSMVGDLTGGSANVWDFVPDGKCDGKDVSVAAKCFGSYPGCSAPLIWNANCDVNNDGKVDGKDIAIVAKHFGEHYP